MIYYGFDSIEQCYAYHKLSMMMKFASDMFEHRTETIGGNAISAKLIKNT